MINLEWLRTFRAVYRTKSLSNAAEMLKISQPTISQHISTLEAHMGQKLFIRKSKGVVETDEGKMLNTLIAGSIESLEEVENLLISRNSKLKTTITIGISEHLYKAMLCHRFFELGEYVHVKFGTKESLVKDVEEGRLLYAIIPGEVNTFDIVCQPLFDQNLVLAATEDVKLEGLRKMVSLEPSKAEQLLTNQTWYAHDAGSSYIKLYWITVFNKKRPAIIPNYVIPNEYEALSQLSKGTGLIIALEQNVIPFVKNGSLKICDIPAVPFRSMSLISNKKKVNSDTTNKIYKMLAER